MKHVINKAKTRKEQLYGKKKQAIKEYYDKILKEKHEIIKTKLNLEGYTNLKPL